MYDHCRRICVWMAVLFVCTVAHGIADDAQQSKGEEKNQDGDRVIVLEKGDEVPTNFKARVSPRGIIKAIKDFTEDMPESHTAKIYVTKVLNQNYGEYDDALKRMVMLNPDGEKDGEEWMYDAKPESVRLLRTIPWKHGVKNGEEKLYGESNNESYLKKTRTWKDGDIEGTVKVYYPDEEVMTEIPYKEGKQNGKSKSYTPDGKVKKVVPYKNGKRHGKVVEYWPGTDQKKKVVPCKDGEVNGEVQMYYEDGQLKAKMPFKEDSLHGVEIRYDEDGKEETKRYWHEGEAVPEGVYKSKHEDEKK